MSVRLPPHVELMREETREDVVGELEDAVVRGEAAHLRLLAEAEQVRLDAEVLEGPHLAGDADAGLHLVEDEQHLVLVAELADGAEELGAEVVVAAFALDRLHDEGRDVVLALVRGTAWPARARPARGARRRRATSAVTGKWSFGLSMRGQSNFGKYWVLRGSVLVSESV